MYKKISLAVIIAAFSGMTMAEESGLLGAAQETAESAATAVEQSAENVMGAAQEDAQKVAESAKSTGLSDLDADKDGVISAEEAQANPDLAKSFESVDENKDGKIDAAEFAQFEAIQSPAPEGTSAE
ncbi:MAG: hypothetical protein AXA67_06855 [Methylothermaceae bacteria B42]|nr:MAG: hypothetical protein AXA67_06855 [Methylothermaceae bacteria B42]HHJ40256.1 hypothetical protein [Methylothermaceae bacterium]